MLQLLGLVVNHEPVHAEHLRQHAFNEVVAADQALCNLSAFFAQPYDAFFVHADQLVAFEPAHRHGDRRRTHFQPTRKRGRNDKFAFTLRLGDGFEIIFFRNGNFQADLFIVTARPALLHSP